MKGDSRIWILEDDPETIFVYHEIFDIRYQLNVFSTLEELQLALINSSIEKGNETYSLPELLIADLRLPDGNFLEFLGRENIPRFLSIPFLIVSSYDDIDILRTCFDEGAIDYLTKPFKKIELIVKAERHLKKNNSSIIDGAAENFTFEPETLALKRGNHIFAQLTARELQIFSVLHRSRGQMISRQRIQSEVWRETKVSSKALDVHLFNLRKKLVSLNLVIQFNPPNNYRLLGDHIDLKEHS